MLHNSKILCEHYYKIITTSMYLLYLFISLLQYFISFIFILLLETTLFDVGMLNLNLIEEFSTVFFKNQFIFAFILKLCMKTAKSKNFMHILLFIILSALFIIQLDSFVTKLDNYL